MVIWEKSGHQESSESGGVPGRRQSKETGPGGSSWLPREKTAGGSHRKTSVVCQSQHAQLVFAEPLVYDQSCAEVFLRVHAPLPLGLVFTVPAAGQGRGARC